MMGDTVRNSMFNYKSLILYAKSCNNCCSPSDLVDSWKGCFTKELYGKKLASSLIFNLNLNVSYGS